MKRNNKFDCAEIPIDTYLEMLEKRRVSIAHDFHWVIPNCVWEYFIERVEEIGCCPNVPQLRPYYVVDNLALNGDYYPYKNCKRADETDEEFEKRQQKYVLAFLEEDDGTKYVLYSILLWKVSHVLGKTFVEMLKISKMMETVSDTISKL